MCRRFRLSGILPTLLYAAASLLLTACEREVTPSAPGVTPPPRVATGPAQYVGSEACRGCHGAEWDAWQNSQHDLALQPAGPLSVLGRFDGAHLGSEFSADDGRYRITPYDAEEPRSVVYTFGVAPLQQYVIPAGNGALSTYPIAWDARPESAGGQRWFDLNGASYPRGDPMHWAGRANRWNSQCADCHSTGVRKGYDAERMSYETTYEVEDVGCEACHGPGSRHVEDPTTAALASLHTQADQIDACAPCHSRRAELAEGFRPGRPYLDHYAPRLLSTDLYQVDGQIDEEVYVYGSFLQSRMHRAGVVCSNCHEPHAARLLRPGNETCTWCHQVAPSNQFAALAAGDYDSVDHHFHPPDTPGAQCVSCHMPEKVYMGVDPRRDHSFRIPRPDLSDALGVPNACNACHQDRTASWASDVIASRFGPDRPAHFAPTFARAEAAEPGADAELAALVADEKQPIMVRASALARLGAYQRGYTLDAIRLATRGEPLLRYAAPRAAASLSPDNQWRLLAPLLTDDLRAVRHQAVTALLPTAADEGLRERLAPHVDVWLAEQALNLDSPEVLTNVAGAHLAMGQPVAAEQSLERALELQPSWVPALMNLADVYRRTGRDAQAGPMLERALSLAPDEPEVNYGYALWLSRQQRLADGLTYFQQAATLAPEQSGFAYAYALALNDSGNGDRAVIVLSGLLDRWPDDEPALFAIATMLRDQGRFAEALIRVEHLLTLRPGDADLIRFRDALAAATASA
jgi:tetratricopeptide (TPR) repeat protein